MCSKLGTAWIISQVTGKLGYFVLNCLGKCCFEVLNMTKVLLTLCPPLRLESQHLQLAKRAGVGWLSSNQTQGNTWDQSPSGLLRLVMLMQEGWTAGQSACAAGTMWQGPMLQFPHLHKEGTSNRRPNLRTSGVTHRGLTLLPPSALCQHCWYPGVPGAVRRMPEGKRAVCTFLSPA